MRLCDLILQTLAEMPTLAGLENDLELKQSIDGKILAYRAHKLVPVVDVVAKLYY